MTARAAEWHLIAGEYPPQLGGVSDYTHEVAGGLAAAGDEVHVWCPPAAGDTPRDPGVTVHRETGRFSPADLARVGRRLDRHPAPRRLLVQWVPHSYGYHSLNLAFCLWLWRRARLAGDEVQLMVHEPYLSFRRGAWRQNGAAVVHRAMTAVLLQAARRVWVSTPLWADWWRPYTAGRRVPFTWLPIPSNLPPADPAAAAGLRARYAPPGTVLLGHFGTYGEPIASLLRPLLPALLGGDDRRSLMLLGRGGTSFRDEVLREAPELASRIHAPGGLPGECLASHLRACDLMVQPYPAGVNSRRGTVMAALREGVPVATSSGWLTEPIWAESGAVALAPSEEAPEMRELVESLLADPARRERMADAGRDLYRSRFDVGNTIAALRGTA